MAEITRILEAIDDGDPHAAEELLPLVYEERRLASNKLAREAPGQTLQPTALVHEAIPLLVEWVRIYQMSDAATAWDPEPSLKMLERFTLRISLASGLPGEHTRALVTEAAMLIAPTADASS